MVEEVKGLGTGGGGVPYRHVPRRPQASAQQEDEPEALAGRREGDSADLSRPPAAPQAVQELLVRLEGLQKDLVSGEKAGQDAASRACRAQLAEAEVALSNLLGASGEPSLLGASGKPSADLLRRAPGSPPRLSAERVLKLLGDGEAFS